MNFSGIILMPQVLLIIGDLESMSVEQCREYYSRWYTPDNAVLVIVGDIDEEGIIEQVERHFGSKERRGQESVNSRPLFFLSI